MVAFPSQAVTSDTNLTPAGSGTYYLPFSGKLAVTGTVEQYYIRIPKAGRLKNPRFLVAANAALGDVTIALYKNGAVVSGASVVIAAGTSGTFTPAWDVAVAAGDLVCYRLVRIGNSGAFQLSSVQIDYEADDGTATGWIVASTAGGVIASSSVSWHSPSHNPQTIWSGTASYANHLSTLEYLPWGTNATVTAIRAPWLTGSTTGAMTLAVAKNGAAALTATLPAGSPAVVRQTGSVALAPGDIVSLLLDSTLRGSNNVRLGMVQIDVVWSNAEFELISHLAPNSTGSYSDPGVDNFRPPAALSRNNPAINEATAQIKLAEASRVHNLRGQQYLAARSADWPTLVRKNGADTALRFSNPAGGGGAYAGVNATDEILIAAGDLISIADRIPAGSGANSNAIGVRMSVVTVTLGTTPPQEVNVPAGQLLVTGARPTLLIDQLVTTTPGSLLLTGLPAAIVTNVEIDIPAGALVLEGRQPTARVGVSVVTSPDRLVVEGLAPLIFTDFRAVLPQQAALAVVEPPPPGMRLSQQATLAAGYVIPPVAVSQQAVLILVDGAPCVTERCQLWRIQRRDGVEFRYTSLDRDVFYGGQRFKSCGSLNPSASEDASTLGTVSNIELEGIISDDGITEADLYGGLFDDAYVTVDLVAWGAAPEAPRRLASGWTGELSQGDTGFKMEVLGAGSRLDQQALVQMVTPGCRWVFGDARCGIDLEGLKIAGTVTGSVSRSVFGAALAGDGAGRQWENGSVRFTSGPNEGQRLEVRSVDFGAGVINLWPSAAFRADPGDTFDLYPGCDKARDGGCSLYANVINHGGFPDVPGNDSILETPDAQY